MIIKVARLTFHLLLIAGIAVLISCGSAPRYKRGDFERSRERGTGTRHPAGSRQGYQIARIAANLVGKASININGRRYRFDCSGLAQGIYENFGYHILDTNSSVSEIAGTRMIYNYTKQHNRLHRNLIPRIGDIVFFNDTYDNGAWKRDKENVTHVAIVERIDENGTITYIHVGSRGIVRARMNLFNPTEHYSQYGEQLNSFMRRKRSNDPPGTRYLAGELFEAFATIVE